MPGGGGLYIANGNLRQDGGSITLQHSSSEGPGGGLVIEKGGLHQHAGDFSCRNCTATKTGGCLAVMGVQEVGVDSNGSIQAHSCKAFAGQQEPKGECFVLGGPHFGLCLVLLPYFCMLSTLHLLLHA